MPSRRELCGALLTVPLASPLLATTRFDAVVRRRGGTHSTLAAALAAAPPDDRPWRILLGRGRWNERLIVWRPNVELIGEGRRNSLLIASAASGHEKPGGGRWGTYGSATLTIEAPGFVARDVTVANGFDYVAALKTNVPPDKQAVALTLGNEADRSIIDRVSLIGHQDTFYVREGRALIRDCFITGSVDFIFGGAAARFEHCEIRSRLRPGEVLQGYIAAPSTPRAHSTGLVFDRCRLTREAGVPDASVYLGRPWRAGGNMNLLGAAAFLNCWMDEHIHPEGWTWMHYRVPDGPDRRLEPGDARLFEFSNHGPGARINPSRRQLPQSGMRDYGRAAMFGDWRP